MGEEQAAGEVEGDRVGEGVEEGIAEEYVLEMKREKAPLQHLLPLHR